MTEGIPNALEDFLPDSNCKSRTSADVCITLIWKNVGGGGKDLECITSPTASSFLRGEVNLLRYFFRRFNLFNFNSLDEIRQIKNEALIDSLHAEFVWGSGKVHQLMSTILDPALKKSQFLNGIVVSIADVFAYSIMTQSGTNKMAPAIQQWMQRCKTAFSSSLAARGN